MRILLTKISDKQHALEVVRRDGSREKTVLVTREFLYHDLLHYAVESTAGAQYGFWGALAAGKTLADLNDRSGCRMADLAGGLATVEQMVGMITDAVKARDVPAGDVVTEVRGYHEALGQALPGWCTEEFVDAVRERMRRLLGHWKATPYRQTMEIGWPEAMSSSR